VHLTEYTHTGPCSASEALSLPCIRRMQLTVHAAFVIFTFFNYISTYPCHYAILLSFTMPKQHKH